MLAWETPAITNTDDLTWPVWGLHHDGLSIRPIAKRPGPARMRVQRILAAGPPVVGDGELPLALLADDAIQHEPHEYLTPPCDFAGLVEVADNLPTRRRDGKIRQAQQWTDAHGHPDGTVGTPCAIPGCNRPISYAPRYPHPQSPSVDHIRPVRTHPELLLAWDNLRISHLVCNQRAHDELDNEADSDWASRQKTGSA